MIADEWEALSSGFRGCWVP